MTTIKEALYEPISAPFEARNSCLAFRFRLPPSKTFHWEPEFTCPKHKSRKNSEFLAEGQGFRIFSRFITKICPNDYHSQSEEFPASTQISKENVKIAIFTSTLCPRKKKQTNKQAIRISEIRPHHSNRLAKRSLTPKFRWNRFINARMAAVSSFNIELFQPNPT